MNTTKNTFLSDQTYHAMIQEIKRFQTEMCETPELRVSTRPLQPKTGITVLVTATYNIPMTQLTDKRLSYISQRITSLMEKYHMRCKKSYISGYTVDYYVKPDWQYWINNPVEEPNE